MKTRRNVLALAAGLAPASFVGTGAFAAAESPWPTKPVRIVIGFPPGGGLDTLMRVLLPVLSSKLGTTVFIENKPGAIGTIGNQLVATSPPDGYTFLATVVASYTTTVKMIKVQYEALRDLPPVAIFASGGQAFITAATSKFRSLNDVFEFARARPGVVNFGIIGKGTQDHIAGEFLRREQKLQWEYIPFNGTAQIFQALMAGDIHLTCMSFSVILPHVQAGTAVALAVAGMEPSPFLAGVPPAGLPRYVSDYTYAIAGPRGLPDAIVKRFHHALAQTLADPVIQAELKDRSLSPQLHSPEDSARTIGDETVAIAPLLASMDLRIE
jgi:tripartite-type tricarboxylate transporter receptor subunit TctC